MSWRDGNIAIGHLSSYVIGQFWLDACLDRINHSGEDVVAITNVRFKNELERVAREISWSST